MISVKNISKRYKLGKTAVQAIDSLSIGIEVGEFAALAGPSGSGKTTLLNLIGCLDKPDTGKIFIDSTDVTAIPLPALAGLRRSMFGFIFQSFNLLPVLTAYENVEYPLLFSKASRTERRARVNAWLERVGLSAHARHRPDQMSGGQRQRVAIARAMIANPRVVLADEPTANLDSKTGAGILDLLQRINEETDVTFVFATHEPQLMERAGRIIHLSDGALTADNEITRELEYEKC
jgi:putative ABC transport system ATP-binding protein